MPPVKMPSFVILTELLLFVLIGFFALHPINNYDFWFHVKYGEFISQTHSLPFKDYFSHTAFGQPAIPYEWLFQIVIYLIYHHFGPAGVQAVIVAFSLTYTLLFRQILKEIFAVSLLPRLTLVGGLFLISYDYFVERPQIVAYALFMATLYLVLKRVWQNQGALFLTVPLFLIWTNLHASMILGLYLLLAYGALLFILGRRREAIPLLLFGVAGTAVTLLPPLGTKVYQLLWIFYHKRDFITRAINEWVPLSQLAIRFYIYLAVMAVASLSFIWAAYKMRRSSSFSSLLLFLPLIPLGLFVMTGVRQTPFSLPAILLLFVPAIKLIKLPKTQAMNLMNQLACIIVLILLSYGLFLYRRAEDQAYNAPLDYPSKAMPFIKSHLSGNMFNEYYLGGYLMYQLGPQFKTYIDGRTDMFLPTILPEYSWLTWNANTSDQDYLTYFNKLVSKYHVSWAILSTSRYTLSWRLARILGNDPNWYLVYFDDAGRIFVRNTGLNDQTIKQYNISAAIPLGTKIYKPGLRDQARKEYQKMNDLTPSAIALNALGYLDLEDQKYDEAKNLFEKALQINPNAAAPKMNLAELAAKDKDFPTAINLYRQAIADDPERGLAYLRLGQLLKQTGKTEQAKTIWKQGLTATPDEDILNKIKAEL